MTIQARKGMPRAKNERVTSMRIDKMCADAGRKSCPKSIDDSHVQTQECQQNIPRHLK